MVNAVPVIQRENVRALVKAVGKRCGSFLVLLLFSVVPAGSQESVDSMDLPPLDESEFSSEQDQPGPGYEENYYDEINGEAGMIPTAVIEGVQISAEPGERPNEKVITAYFIFKDKPSSYFYEVKVKEKKVVFEFNDTKTSGAPVESVSEPPIRGFTVEDRKVNVNKEIKGLRPEYHNQIRVVFNVDAVPRVHVSDEYNVISFTYKWTTDSSKLDDYVIKPPKMWPWWAGGGTLAAGGGFAYWWFFIREKPVEPLEELPITDLPLHIHQ
jgi:hypothetical protein